MGRLDGLTRALPNPDLFVAMYVRREAVLSSQIEGTQSTLDDVLAFELDNPGRALPGGRRGGRELRPSHELRPQPSRDSAALIAP